jgi:hypothetical protein
MISRVVRCENSGRWLEPLPDLDSPRTLVLAFGESDGILANPAPIRQLREHFSRGHVVGCSTSGQILGDSIVDGGLVALIVQPESGEIRVARTDLAARGDSRGAGEAIGEALSAPDLRGVFVLSDGIKVNGSLLAEGLRSRLPKDVCATGGLAGDGSRFQTTWVCCDGDPQPGLVAAVGFYGTSLALWHGCMGGWDAFGPERVVTRSDGNCLYELDGKPALAIYESYLGDKAKDLPASALLFPLAVRDPTTSKVLVRTVLGVSRQDQSMTFAGDIPQGWHVQLMQANFDRLIDGAAQAAAMMPLRDLAGASSVCLPISCVGRRLILRHRAEEELEEIGAALPRGTPRVGFYSYGELSPLVGSTCELHNQTMTLTILAERGGKPDAAHPRAAAA